MIIAHYINPYFQASSAEFDLLILEDSQILTRSVCRFELPLNEAFLLDNANIVLNDYCDEYNSNPEILVGNPIDLHVDELVYDLPSNEETP